MCTTPLLGRFLSADKIIQAPENTQSYNRFSYVMNNPLMFTDPSGYKAAMNIEINATTIYDERGNVIGMRPFNGNVSQYGVVHQFSLLLLIGILAMGFMLIEKVKEFLLMKLIITTLLQML